MKPDCGTNHEPVALRGGRLVRARVGLGRLRGERGQGVTEFAMVLPVFAFLVLVVILFGKALYTYIQLTHIANEAARQIAVDQPQSGSVCSYLQSLSALPGGVTLQINYPNPDGVSNSQQAGEAVTVKASASASGIPFIGIPTLNSSATMRLEQTTGSNLTGSCP